MSFVGQETVCTGCGSELSVQKFRAAASSRRSVPVRAGTCSVKSRPQRSRWACRRGGVHMCNNLFICERSRDVRKQ
jgi:hypothetical protein